MPPADRSTSGELHPRLQPVAIVGAMPEEVERLAGGVEDRTETRSGPFRISEGRLEGVPVMVAECGVGKVNAGALTQALLAGGAKSLIFTGVAGALAPELKVGDLVISEDAVQHDVDVTGLGYIPGEVPGSGLAFRADPELVSVAQRAAAAAGLKASTGRVASGDLFVASDADRERIEVAFGAACVEMEGAACAQVCAAWDVPFVVVRCISDTADGEARTDFRAFTELAAAQAERLVRAMLTEIAGGSRPST